VSFRGGGATIHTAESSFDKAALATLRPIRLWYIRQVFRPGEDQSYATRLAKMRHVMALPGSGVQAEKNAIGGALGVGGACGGDKG